MLLFTMKLNINIEKIQNEIFTTHYKNFSIIPIQKGVSTNVFNLVYKDENLYLKIIEDTNTLKCLLKANTLMLDKNIHIPEIIFSKENTENIIGLPYYIEKAILGNSIEKISDNSITKDILVMAGEDLAKINSIQVGGFGDIENEEEGQLKARHSSYLDFALEDFESRIEELKNLQIIDTQIELSIKKYLEANIKLLEEDNISFLSHGDFCTEHIYSNNNKYSGIIDFGDIRGCNKYHDLGHFYTFNSDSFAHLVKGYNYIYQLPSNYLERVKLDAIIFGVRKLHWVARNRPHKIKNHAVYKLFNQLH